jgi:von Willebrand factor type A domain
VDVSFLSPKGALVAVGVLLPLVALFLIRRRAARARRTLGLEEPGTRGLAAAVAAILSAGLLLGLAAAQPVVAQTTQVRERTDAESFVVLDISRSMLARDGSGSPTRLDRARTIARHLRTELPELRMGVVSLTDRVLPHLFPNIDREVFEATVSRSLGIEQPPPRSSFATTATALDALGGLRTHKYFSADTRTRIVVVLTDGESQQVSLARLAALFRQDPPIKVVFVHLWGAGERVYTEGAPEPQYEPDPSSKLVLEGLARTVDGHYYAESDLVEAAAKTRELLGSGPTVVRGRQSGEIELAPFMAAAAFAPVLLLLWRRDR